MIAFSAAAGSLQSSKADVTAVFITEEEAATPAFRSGLTASLGALPPSLIRGVFTGKAGQSLPGTLRGKPARQALWVGLGPAATVTEELIRRGAAISTKYAAAQRARSLAFTIPMTMQGTSITVEQMAFAAVEGTALAAYRFDKYIRAGEDTRPTLRQSTLLIPDERAVRSVSIALKEAVLLSEAVYAARDLANAPGNEIYPETLAQRTQALARRTGFRVRVLKEKEIARLGMGGLLGVSRGSHRPPRFLILEHKPARARNKRPIVLVGKGVTFDSGGISIKPSQNMAEMKMDMSGAAAVIGTFAAIASLRIPRHVIGLVPATENLPGGNALKPGDILKHLNGITSEVDNTDAEGRLILADALAYADRYKPEAIIDLATLTGAVVVALGHHATGMLGTDDGVMRKIQNAGLRTYERVWQLPLFEEYEKLIKSEIADVKNVGGRWGGAITAALFLKRFTGSHPWVHLDIAGTAIQEDVQDYIPRGGSGVGVRLLTDLLRHWEED